MQNPSCTTCSRPVSNQSRSVYDSRSSNSAYRSPVNSVIDNTISSRSTPSGLMTNVPRSSSSSRRNYTQKERDLIKVRRLCRECNIEISPEMSNAPPSDDELESGSPYVEGVLVRTYDGKSLIGDQTRIPYQNTFRTDNSSTVLTWGKTNGYETVSEDKYERIYKDERDPSSNYHQTLVLRKTEMQQVREIYNESVFTPRPTYNPPLDSGGLYILMSGMSGRTSSFT